MAPPIGGKLSEGVSWPVSCCTGVAAAIVAQCVCSEVSSIALQARWFCRRLFGVGSAAYAASSGLFALLFLVLC